MISKSEFLQKYKISVRSFNCCGIDWQELTLIYNDYETKRKQLHGIAKSLSNFFDKKYPNSIHSIRWRVKDSEHLLEKIVRKKLSSSTKYASIDHTNYFKYITDFIGLRILLLYKEDWKDIHNYIVDSFENNPRRYIRNHERDYVDDLAAQYQAEQPIAYIRYGDKNIYRSSNGDLRLEYSNKDYRSIHYIVKYKGYYAEIQVRTLAEEIYGEFDHNIRYPYNQENNFLKTCSSTLSKITIAVDDIVSMYRRLPPNIIEECDPYFEDEIFEDYYVNEDKKKVEPVKTAKTCADVIEKYIYRK